MLGFSLTKLLFTAAVVILVWMVFKHAGRILRGGQQAPSRVDRARRAAEEMTRARASQAQSAPEPPTVELVSCPQCGNYIAQGSACSCGYKDRGR
ncbi:MAG: hypothetical protein VR70_09525 [Rhodospirillaceae bacterium BRH_c57]|nr:MAG: hypothetical protein VR70_09525 [Rhodospirillaceae bacterium BRH_c57]